MVEQRISATAEPENDAIAQTTTGPAVAPLAP